MHLVGVPGEADMPLRAGQPGVRLQEGLDAVGHRADAVIDGGKLVGVQEG